VPNASICYLDSKGAGPAPAPIYQVVRASDGDHPVISGGSTRSNSMTPVPLFGHWITKPPRGRLRTYFTSFFGAEIVIVVANMTIKIESVAAGAAAW